MAMKDKDASKVTDTFKIRGYKFKQHKCLMIMSNTSKFFLFPFPLRFTYFVCNMGNTLIENY